MSLISNIECVAPEDRAFAVLLSQWERGGIGFDVDQGIIAFLVGLRREIAGGQDEKQRDKVSHSTAKEMRDATKIIGDNRSTLKH